MAKPIPAATGNNSIPSKGSISMHIRTENRFARSLIALLLCLSCASCAREQIEYQSNGFNRAIEQTTNELLLLNIVRASMDLPLYFTKLIKFSGSNLVSGSVAPKLPFGPKAVANYDLGITTSWNGGVSAIEFADLNQDEGLAGLRAPIDFYVFDQYFQANYSWMVLASILFDGFDVSGTVNQGLIWNYNKFCASSPDHIRCKYIDLIKRRCGSSWIKSSAVPYYGRTDGSFVSHQNDAATKCGYLQFQSFLTLLAIAGFVTDLVSAIPPAAQPTGKAKAKSKGSDGGAVANTAESDSEKKYYVRIRFADAPEVNEAARIVDERLRNIRRQALTPLMRSPKRMIEFLGELTSLQIHARDRFTPQTIVRGHFVNLFRIERTDTPASRAALTVRGPNNALFNVPQPNLGAEDRDQSLIVLSVVNDMVNLGTKKASFPAPTAIEVRTQQ